MSAHPSPFRPRLHFNHRGRSIELATNEIFSVHAPDSYRDAPASELESIIEDISSGQPWRTAVANRYAVGNPWLHKVVTSPARDLFFRQHPPSPNARILDIGAGWGQIALPLAHGCRVCALEPTSERLRFIRAAAQQENLADRMWFIQANYLDANFRPEFDLITCIGVLEWVGQFSAIEDPFEAQRSFLRKARQELAPAGQMVVAIENRLGLKYLLGAPDDHTGESGLHIFDRELAARKWRAKHGSPLRVLTHSLAEYRELFAGAGFARTDAYAAFPDYKLPQLIVPVEDLATPKPHFDQIEIPLEHSGRDGAVLPFQDELRSMYRSLAPLGAVHCFAPSFFFILS